MDGHIEQQDIIGFHVDRVFLSIRKKNETARDRECPRQHNDVRLRLLWFCDKSSLKTFWGGEERL
jgi:hypothetical protein